jgi:hypothetical protein
MSFGLAFYLLLADSSSSQLHCSSLRSRTLYRYATLRSLLFYRIIAPLKYSLRFAAHNYIVCSSHKCSYLLRSLCSLHRAAHSIDVRSIALTIVLCTQVFAHVLLFAALMLSCVFATLHVSFLVLRTRELSMIAPTRTSCSTYFVLCRCAHVLRMYSYLAALCRFAPVKILFANAHVFLTDARLHNVRVFGAKLQICVHVLRP